VSKRGSAGPAPKAWSPRAILQEKRSRRTEYYCRIDASGFAAVFFVLVFIMLTTTQSYPDLPRWAVDLPKCEHSILLPGARREDALELSVQRDERIYFMRHGIGLKEFPDAIQEALRGGAEKRVYLYIDARAEYGAVLAALTAIQQSGVEHVSFVTDSPGPRANPVP
jgi:biopolymer transport protein ExbD